MPNKSARNPYHELIDKITEQLPGGHEALAKELGVSGSSLTRWYAGTVRPRPEFEGRLRAVAERIQGPGLAGAQAGLFEWPDAAADIRLREAVTSTCRELRETFHRRGRLSSRQEALDELAKLLFAHVMSATHEGPGIGRHLLNESSGAAKRLREFVARQYHAFTPASLAHEMKASDFVLRLRDGEDELASDIVSCFHHLRERDVLAAVRGLENIDVLNDAFGQFVADSFVQEKELGQYLTPNEVVRFMVRLGFRSLAPDTHARLLDPATAAGVGAILDPSCGVGTFLTEALRVMYLEARKVHGTEIAQELVTTALASNIVGIDKSERMLRLAMSNLAMFGAAQTNLHLANALARSGPDGEVTGALEGRAQLILTNPPFGARFEGSALSKYQLPSTWSTRRPRAVDSELLFLERYLDWLVPGGHLVAIVPDSVLTNKGLFEDLRQGVYRLAEVRGVISLPSVTFGVAGTTTKTSILHLTKRRRPSGSPCNVFFAVCDSLGYDVQTRGSTRIKVPRGQNQLPAILDAHEGREAPPYVREAQLRAVDARWDAGFHSGLSNAVLRRIERCNGNPLHVRDVAVLSDDRLNPARLGLERTFSYIEISDVDGVSCTVRSKIIPCAEAPSRARRRVRTGDVLVSTVRPERRTVGVVPQELDGAICSTGFAVLRCTKIHPQVLAHLLRLDFVTEQVLKENSGIAYPAVEESRFLDVVLPIDAESLSALGAQGQKLAAARSQVANTERLFGETVGGVVESWLSA